MIIRVSKFSKLYCEDYLKELDINPQIMPAYWFEAFRFLVSRILIQGRPAKTTQKLRQMVEDSVTTHLDCASTDGITRAKPNRFMDARQAFQEMMVDGRPFKKKNDVDMVFGTDTKSRYYNTLGLLRYISTLPSGNIVHHSINEIKTGRLIPHYRKLTSFYGVGPIAAATYLRDLVVLFHDEVGSHITTVEELIHIQPVDSCVKKVALEVGIEFERGGILHEGRSIVEACRQVSPSNKLPIAFNQGASWICANSFEAALKLLGEKSLVDDLSTRFK